MVIEKENKFTLQSSKYIQKTQKKVPKPRERKLSSQKGHTEHQMDRNKKEPAIPYHNSNTETKDQMKCIESCKRMGPERDQDPYKGCGQNNY